MSEQKELVDIKSVATTKLQSTWTFWYDDRKPHINNLNEYQKSIKKLGSFNTLEEFWVHYSYLTNPDSYPRECSLYLVRGTEPASWEAYPKGGQWLVRVRKRNTLVDRLWEELCFACVGELFEDPDVVCVSVSTRVREDALSVWTKNNTNRFAIGEKLKELLNLDESTQLDYKTFASSLNDGSSFKNTKSYAFNPDAAALLKESGGIPAIYVSEK